MSLELLLYPASPINRSQNSSYSGLRPLVSNGRYWPVVDIHLSIVGRGIRTPG